MTTTAALCFFVAPWLIAWGLWHLIAQAWCAVAGRVAR